MPYFYEALETPVNSEHFWEQLQEIWEFVHNDLMDVRFEQEEEAIEKLYRDSQDPNDLRLDSLGVARYRDTDDRDNLMHFHGLGLDALDETEAAIVKREMTAHFMRQWSILLSCHGYVAAAIMARGTDVQGKRAGKAGGNAVKVDAQRVWFSHYYLDHYNRKQGRSITEDAIEKLVNHLVNGQSGLDLDSETKQFFAKMLQPSLTGAVNEHRLLKNTYRETELSGPAMRKLRQRPIDGIPLLNPKLPLPKVGRS